MKEPEISVVVPVFNTGEYLDVCLGSICAQSIKDIEIILVDDGSKDPLTLSILDTYVDKDKRVKLFRKKNGGQASARNKGLDNASGRYVIFIDSDDFIDEKMLESLVIAIKKSGCVAAECLHIPVSSDEFKAKVPEKTPYDGSFRIVDIEKDRKYLIDRISVFTRIYLREFLEQNSLKFDEELKWAEDVVFSFKTLIKAERVAFIDYVFYYYIVHYTSLTNTLGSSVFDLFNVHLNLIDFLDENSIRKKYEKQVTTRLFKDILYGLNIVRSDITNSLFEKSVSFIKEHKVDYSAAGYLRSKKRKEIGFVMADDFDGLIRYKEKRKKMKNIRKAIKKFFLISGH